MSLGETTTKNPLLYTAREHTRLSGTYICLDFIQYVILNTLGKMGTIDASQQVALSDLHPITLVLFTFSSLGFTSSIFIIPSVIYWPLEVCFIPRAIK